MPKSPISPRVEPLKLSQFESNAIPPTHDATGANNGHEQGYWYILVFAQSSMTTAHALRVQLVAQAKTLAIKV
jgi:hypothetical protein